MDRTSLGNRMKEYERASQSNLTKRLPVIIRIDGKAFHTFTRDLKKPFDDLFLTAMHETAYELLTQIAGCRLAYTQSDEISLLLINYEHLNTDPWFKNTIQKLVSIAASLTTITFYKKFTEQVKFYKMEHPEDERYYNTLMKKVESNPIFDARVFVLPKEEVCNYFIWRQQDCVRNSILSMGQYYIGNKAIEGKSCGEVCELLRETEHPYESIHSEHQKGFTVYTIENEDLGKKQCMFGYGMDFAEKRNVIQNIVNTGE